MSEHDHEYALLARPNARLRVGFSTDAGTLTHATVTVEYAAGDDHGTLADPADAAGTTDDDDPTTGDPIAGEPGDAGIEWRGRTFELYRDGERVLDRGLSGIDLGRLADDRFGSLERYGRRAVDRLRRVRASVPLERVRSGSGTIPVPQPDGTTLMVALRNADATFECYEDDGGQWRWRLVDNGEALAVSGTGYDSEAAARESIHELKEHALGAAVEA